MPAKPTKSAKVEDNGLDGQQMALLVLGVVFAILFVGTFLDKIGIMDPIEDLSGGSDKLTIEQMIVRSKIDLGDEVANVNDVVVRQMPGENILGSQKALSKGRVVAGPENRFDRKWWLVDFEKAPDGWVISSDITNKVGLLTAINIIPITFGFLKPVLVILSILIIIFIIMISFKASHLRKTLDKKTKLEKEQLSPQPFMKSTNENESVEDDLAADQDDSIITETVFDDDQNDLIESLPVSNLPISENGEAPRTQNASNRRWNKIQSLLASYNQNDWKQAIMESDMILDEMLEKMGYQGTSIGEKLKMIEPSDFLTLNYAWDAHKVRNRIAHGSSYVLSKDEAERVIGLYEKVFREFYYIN